MRLESFTWKVPTDSTIIMPLQVEKVDVLLSQWRGRAVILLNAGWTIENVDPQFIAFVKSFNSVYSFLPLAIQVIFTTRLSQSRLRY